MSPVMSPVMSPLTSLADNLPTAVEAYSYGARRKPHAGVDFSARRTRP